MSLNKFSSVIFVVLTLISSAYASEVYNVPPSFSPYSEGSVKYEVLSDALAELNYVRWLAGVPNNVTLNDEYTRRAQIAAVLLDANDILTHEPSKPADMDDEFYRSGYDAASHGNISVSKILNGPYVKGVITIKDSIKMYMEDTDSHNVAATGHRRWLINPRLKQTGFGISTRRGYSVTYVIEEFPYSRNGMLSPEDYEKYLDWLEWPIPDEFIAWPSCKHPHPLSWFESKTAWSVTLNRNVFAKCNPDTVSVRLIRLNDGTVWNFGNAGDNGYFEISPDNVAYDECLIFCPDDIERYRNGETWSVEVWGLERKDGKPGYLSYTVSFTD